MWNLNEVLICIVFVAKAVEQFSIYLLAICTFSEDCLLNSLAYLLIGLFVLLVFNFLRSLYIPNINPMTDEWVTRIFPHSVGFFL
jgi:hypothetical protein